MFDTDTDIDSDIADLGRLDAAATLAFARGAQAAEQAARVGLLETAAHWADLHGHLDQQGAESPTLPGAERLVALGGDGTPAVAEFAPAEFGAVLGLSPHAAAKLIGDALDLRHRLPLIWARVRAGQVKAWVGQQIAATTRQHPAPLVGMVDAALAPYADRLSLGRIEAIIEGIVIDADPAAAAARADAAARATGVWLSQSTEHGIKDIWIKTEAANAIWFDAALDRIADGLQLLGDRSDQQVRRGKAVGIIAQPQHTLDLYHQAATAAGADQADHDASAPAPGPPRAGTPVDPRPPVTLYVHLSDQALTDGTRVGRLEGIGPVLVDQLRGWLTGCQITIKPVLDLNQQTPIDGYEIPDRLREAVHVRSPADTFPHGSNLSRRKDLDHTVEYRPPERGGPPGQTRLGNLGPLTRFHHRIKTHSNWQVQQPFPGVYVWRSPHGHHWLVDHTGSRPATPT